MATVIHSYPIPEGTKFSCKLPKGASVVRAEFAVTPQTIVGGLMSADGKPLAKGAMKEVLILMVRLDPEQPMRDYSFEIVPDDVAMEEMDYKASVFARGIGGFVHVFQSRDKAEV
jgi:hypothetical protein